MSGEEVLSSLRKQTGIPIIVLSAKDEMQGKVDVLYSGADDYITKPFHNEELFARMEVAFRKSGENVEKRTLQFKDITLDEASYEAIVNGKNMTLTKREFDLLWLLLSNPNKVFTKNNIFESVWKENYVGEDNSINVHISNLRQKLTKCNPDENYIQTVWGIGFKASTK